MNPQITAETITALFDAYNLATGFGVAFNAVWERNLYESARMGLTAEMVTLVIKDRLKGIKTGDRKPASLMPRNLFVGEDVICETICEGHALLAMKRKVVDAAKASVLRATGRPVEDAGPPAKHVSETELMAALRKACG